MAATRPMNSARAPKGLSSAAWTRTAGGGAACCASATLRPPAITSAMIAKNRVLLISAPGFSPWARVPGFAESVTDLDHASQAGKGKTAGMSLTLYFHPLSSYCQKVLIALYEA